MAKANPTQSRVAPVSARLIILLDSEEMGGLWDDYGRWVGRGCMTAVAARAGMASVAQTRETSAVGGARRAGEAVDALKAVFQRDVAETALLGAGNVHGGSGAAMRLIRPA